jgi:hypothetical protein
LFVENPNDAELIHVAAGGDARIPLGVLNRWDCFFPVADRKVALAPDPQSQDQAVD